MARHYRWNDGTDWPETVEDSDGDRKSWPAPFAQYLRKRTIFDCALDTKALRKQEELLARFGDHKDVMVPKIKRTKDNKPTRWAERETYAVADTKAAVAQLQGLLTMHETVDTFVTELKAKRDAYKYTDILGTLRRTITAAQRLQLAHLATITQRRLTYLT
ncbi:hypothetical protein RI367_008664 [Sorochytrium milnesiophthora]